MLSFLQTRPWLFGVNPHGGISVTRLAREGLIYKRDVITYLYNAFIDTTSPVTLAEINDRVAQPPGMHQVMMVSILVTPVLCPAVPCCALLCCAVLCCAVLCCAVSTNSWQWRPLIVTWCMRVTSLMASAFPAACT